MSRLKYQQPLPRLFIGSSRESLPLVEVLADELYPYAQVVKWTDVFESQQTYLTSLQGLPETFDFGIFVLGPDDMVTSRERTQAAPRDNVVFELGLFMQVLGVERTFPVVLPKVKVCSDFLGWQFVEYQEPQGWREFRERIEKEENDEIRRAITEGYKEKLIPAVEKAVVEIARRIKKERLNPNVPIHAVAHGVHEIWPSIEDIVSGAVCNEEKVTVRHLALDLGDAWDLMRDGILEDEDVTNLTWRCLMINPRSPAMAKAQSDSVSVQAAQKAIKLIGKTLSDESRRGKKAARKKKTLKERRVTIEVRAYADPPRVHGFLIEGHALLLSMCDIDEKGRLDANRTPYFRFNHKEGSQPHHVIRSFKNWFEYHWRHPSTLKIWPPPAKIQ